MRLQTGLISSVFLFLVSISTTAQPRSENVELLSHLHRGWDAAATSWSGDLACVAARRGGMVVLDMSDPSHPSEVGHWDDDLSSSGVYFDGRYAYLSLNSSGDLKRFDLQDPSHPQLVAKVDFRTTPKGSFCVVDSLIYLAEYPRLTIVRLTENGELERIGSMIVPVAEDAEVVVQNSIAYFSNWMWITVIDVRDPYHPDSLTIYQTGNLIRSISVSEEKLVAACEGMVHVLDVTDPMHISEVGQIATDLCTEAVVEGNRLYLLDDVSLLAYDITNPADPTRLSEFEAVNGAEELSIHGSYVIGSSPFYGVRFIDFADSLHPVEVGAVSNDNTQILDVKVRDEIAYVADGDAGIKSVDVSDPENPMEIGVCGSAGYVDRIELSENWACVMNDWDQLQYVDITDPTQLTIYGRYRVTELYAINVVNNLVYIASRYHSFTILDWSSPENPIVASQNDSFGVVTKIAIADTIAYLACNIDFRLFLNVIDISDPYNPELIASVQGPDGHLVSWDEMSYTGNRLLLRSSERCYSYDVTNPRRPRLIQAVIPDSTGKVVASDIVGKMHFIANGLEGIRIEDWSYLAHPLVVGYYDTKGVARNIDYVDGVIYVADDTNLGLYHYAFDGVNNPGSVAGPFGFILSPPFPNPFNSSTTISFSLPSASPSASLMVFDPLGRRVAELIPSRVMGAGEYRVQWDASGVAAGNYFVKLRGGESELSRRVTLVK